MPSPAPMSGPEPRGRREPGRTSARLRRMPPSAGPALAAAPRGTDPGADGRAERTDADPAPPAHRRRPAVARPLTDLSGRGRSGFRSDADRSGPALPVLDLRGRATEVVPDQPDHRLDRGGHAGHRRLPGEGVAGGPDAAAASSDSADGTAAARHRDAGGPGDPGGGRRRRHAERRRPRGPADQPAGIGRAVGTARRQGRPGGDRPGRPGAGTRRGTRGQRSPSASGSAATSISATTGSCGATWRRSSPASRFRPSTTPCGGSAPMNWTPSSGWTPTGRCCRTYAAFCFADRRHR